MSPYEKPPAKEKPERRLKILRHFEDDYPAKVELTVRGQTDAYIVYKVDAGDVGLGLVWTKLADEPTVYRVYISAENSQDAQCCCKGFGYTGGCKHVDATRALAARGLI